jgi:putative two-component system response regulator
MDEFSFYKSKILIVDDHPIAIKTLAGSLPRHYTKLVATSGERALSMLANSTNLPDLILLDIMMPDMDGYEVNRRLKADERLRDIPVIFTTSRSDFQDKIEGLSQGAVDLIIKPYELEEARYRIDVHLRINFLQRKLERYNHYLEELVEAKAKEMIEMQLSTIYALIRLTDHRDEIIGGHLERTQQICEKIACQLRSQAKYQTIITDEYLNNFLTACPLFDIGKVGIPDDVYLKPGSLTPEEFEIMKQHTRIGSETLQSVLDKFPNNYTIRLGIEIARSHHEKWDGSGYPDGLAGESIPLSARIMALADVFDALRSGRPYRQSCSQADTILTIQRGSGSQFDPDIVDAFFQIEQSLKDLYA